MSDIAPALELRNCFVDELRRHESGQPELREFINGLVATDFSGNAPVTAPPKNPEVTAHLASSLKGIEPDNALAKAVRLSAADLPWVRILEGADVEPTLEAGLVAAPSGFAQSTTTRLGMFLLSPGLHYPPHQHGALEIYYVVSGSLRLTHGRAGAPFEVGPGEFSVTPSHRIHTLTTGTAPSLILYCWTGDIGAPSWWWEQDDSGWHRVRWEREPAGRWFTVSREPITESVLREAAEI